MKKIYLQLLCLVFLSSCTDPGGDPTFEGFTFGVANNTNKIYDATLYIGGIVNGNFMATDSILVDKIKNGSWDLYGFYFSDENRWKPNLDKIRDLPSERCYFKIKLSDGREKVILNTSSEFFGLDISDGKKEFVNEKGRIYIYIYIYIYI